MKKAIVAVLFVVVFVATPAMAQQAPDWSKAAHRILPLIVGGGWDTSITGFSNGDDTQTVFLWRSITDGSTFKLDTWHIDGSSGGTNEKMTWGIVSRGVGKILLTTPSGSLKFGWIDHSILLTPSGDFTTTAFATLRHKGDDGKTIGETIFPGGVPGKIFSFPVERLGGSETSLMLVNPGNQDTMIRMTLRNTKEVGMMEVLLSPRGGIATMIATPYPEFLGTIDIVADQEVAGFAFKMNADGSFSAVPKGPGR